MEETIKMININSYEERYKDEVVKLILDIQQIEFNVPITIEDQPDLLDIVGFYQQKLGNFWVALDDEKVIGTIALIDCGEGVGGIRKMFVNKDFRGKEFGVGQALLNVLEEAAMNSGMENLYLGTNERLQGAIRFYSKNNYSVIDREDLPIVFPLMKVDTLFFEKMLR